MRSAIDATEKRGGNVFDIYPRKQVEIFHATGLGRIDQEKH